MGLGTKVAISSFVQSGNFESLSLTGFEPATLRCTKFSYEIFLGIFLPDFTIRLKSRKSFY